MTAVVKFQLTDHIAEELRRHRIFAKDAIDEGLTKTALAVQQDAQKRLNRGEKTGRIYKRGRAGENQRIHQASAPGESPASDTGQLAASITFESLSPTSKRVGSVLPRARWLEFGTLHIAERPFLRPAVDSQQRFLTLRVRAALRKKLKGLD